MNQSSENQRILITVCPATKDNGDPCSMTATLDPETGLCMWHDPKRKDRVKAIQSKGGTRGGGLNRKYPKVASPDEVPPPPETLEDCCTWTSWLTVAITTGKVDPRTGKEATNAIKELRASIFTAEKDAELSALKDEIKRLRKLRAVGGN